MTADQIDKFDSWPKFMGCDPHDKKPFAMLWGAVSPSGDRIIFAEWPEEFFWDMAPPGYGVKQYVQVIQDFESGRNQLKLPIRNILWRVMDPSFGRKRSAASGHTLQEDFSDAGIYFDVDVDNDVQSGHLAVRERFEDRTLYVTPNCTNLIHAIGRYIFTDSKSQEKPRYDFKDFPDVLRYLMKFNPIAWVDLKHMGIEQYRIVNHGLGR